MAASGSKRVIYAALIGNFLIAVCKFTASAFTGSAAMFSEGIHSLVDTGNQGLILFGLWRAKRPPDRLHPFGYGMELYFWTFVVAILIFAVGSGISFYEGIEGVLHPHEVESPIWNFVVLGLAIVFEGVAWWIAFKEFRRTQGKRSWYGAVRHSKDPTVFTVLFEDSAAMAGLVIAGVGLFLAWQLDMPVLDGVASIGIGVVLAVVAVVLAIESKGLLIGEGADRSVTGSIRELLAADPRITNVNEILTMHLGPQDILLNVSLDFVDSLGAGEVEAAITEFERRIKREHPHVKRMFIEAQAWRAHAEGGVEGKTLE